MHNWKMMALLVVLMLARQTLAIFPTLEEVKRQLKDIDKVVDQGAPGSAKDGAAGRARTSLGPSSLHGMTSVHNFPVETATQGFYMLNADIMFLDRMWNDFTFIKKLMELTMFSRTSTYNKIKKAFYQYCYSLMEKTLWKTYENMAKSIGFEINREIRSLYDEMLEAEMMGLMKACMEWFENLEKHHKLIEYAKNREPKDPFETSQVSYESYKATYMFLKTMSENSRGIIDESTKQLITTSLRKWMHRIEEQLGMFIHENEETAILKAQFAELRESLQGQVVEAYSYPATCSSIITESGLYRFRNVFKWLLSRVYTVVKYEDKYIAKGELEKLINIMSHIGWELHSRQIKGIIPDEIKELKDMLQTGWNLLKNKLNTLQTELVQTSIRLDDERRRDDGESDESGIGGSRRTGLFTGLKFGERSISSGSSWRSQEGKDSSAEGRSASSGPKSGYVQKMVEEWQKIGSGEPPREKSTYRTSLGWRSHPRPESPESRPGGISGHPSRKLSPDPRSVGKLLGPILSLSVSSSEYYDRGRPKVRSTYQPGGWAGAGPGFLGRVQKIPPGFRSNLEYSSLEFEPSGRFISTKKIQFGRSSSPTSPSLTRDMYRFNKGSTTSILSESEPQSYRYISPISTPGSSPRSSPFSTPGSSPGSSPKTSRRFEYPGYEPSSSYGSGHRTGYTTSSLQDSSLTQPREKISPYEELLQQRSRSSSPSAYSTGYQSRSYSSHSPRVESPERSGRSSSYSPSRLQSSMFQPPQMPSFNQQLSSLTERQRRERELRERELKDAAQEAISKLQNMGRRKR